MRSRLNTKKQKKMHSVIVPMIATVWLASGSGGRAITAWLGEKYSSTSADMSGFSPRSRVRKPRRDGGAVLSRPSSPRP